jgi:hypothetical protein
MSPYQEALSWIQNNPGTSGANGLAKLLLSLGDSKYAFALSECTQYLDRERSALALAVITSYLDGNASAELGHVCRELRHLFPSLTRMARAVAEAKSTVHDQLDDDQDSPAR